MSDMKVWAMIVKELKEYMLKPGSISWGLVFPLVFSLAFIARFGDIDHLIPGLLSISALFGTTSFVASSIIFERRLRTFERLLLAPVSYGEIILAKVLVGAIFGLLVSLVTLILVSHFMAYSIWSLPLVLLYLILSNLAFSALGVYISLAIANSINVMTWLNLIRLPMMFTSGAIASLTLFPRWFLVIGLLTPMTYSVDGLRYGLLYYYDVIPPLESMLALVLMFLLFMLLSIRALKRLY
ncbi:ABC transporter permease [Thermococcus sp.]|uniref:ABC transporter permease n=1 Tax=Thermococcus sp. TaxID=35749 RepID=UPI0025F994AA|nr:ABC transporter permease [Thermococcus sp.]